MIKLAKITEDNFDECIRLVPKEEQKSFVAPNVTSLAEAYVALANKECPIPFAIYNDDKMVGFVLLLYSEANEEEPENTYWVCRFMIDKKFQGRGYGKEGMKAVLNYIKGFPFGEASVVKLSYELENQVARSLYKSVGFIETGIIDDGEMIAKLNLQRYR